MNTVNTYGYSTAQLLVQILKQCGDDLTRENIMKQAASLKNVELDLALPGMQSTPRRRLPRQQAVADDEVQRRALGTVRPDPRGRRPGGLALRPLATKVGELRAGIRSGFSAAATWSPLKPALSELALGPACRGALAVDL